MVDEEGMTGAENEGRLAFAELLDGRTNGLSDGRILVTRSINQGHDDLCNQDGSLNQGHITISTINMGQSITAIIP